MAEADDNPMHLIARLEGEAPPTDTTPSKRAAARQNRRRVAAVAESPQQQKPKEAAWPQGTPMPSGSRWRCNRWQTIVALLLLFILFVMFVVTASACHGSDSCAFYE